MIEILIDILLLYLAGMFIFHLITMWVSYMNNRELFSSPEFTTELADHYPAGVGQALWRETLSVAGMYLAWPLGLIDHDNEVNGKKTDEQAPVLFIHGWTENRQSWRRVLNALKNDQSRRLYTINLWPIDAPVDSYRVQLSRKIDEIFSETKHKKLTLVGHSMGGLIARDYIKQHGSESVERLITLGSPHQGTCLTFPAIAAAAKQMQSNSNFLTELATDKNIESIDVHCIVSVHDNLVVPFDKGWLPGCTRHMVAGYGHVGMVSAPETLNILRTLLYSRPTEDRAAASAGRSEKAAKAVAPEKKKVAKKAPAKKAPAKKAPAKKAPAKKAAAKKAAEKKPVKKAAAQRTIAKKTSPKKNSEGKKKAKAKVKSQLLNKLKEK